jgi:hypothetical protein
MYSYRERSRFIVWDLWSFAVIGSLIFSILSVVMLGHFVSFHGVGWLVHLWGVGGRDIEWNFEQSSFQQVKFIKELKKRL